MFVLILLGYCTMNIYRMSKRSKIRHGKVKKSALQDHLRGLRMNEETKWSSSVEAPKQQSGIESNGASDGVRKSSIEAYNYPRITTGVDLSAGNDDLSIIERSLSLTSVAPRGSAYGRWSNSNNSSKKTNTIDLGLDLSDTLFEGDELQGKKAPGEKGDVYRNPMATHPEDSEGILLKPPQHAAL